MLGTLLAGMLLQASGETPGPYASSLSQEVTELVQVRKDIGQEDFIAKLEALGRNGDDTAYELLGEMFFFAVLEARQDETRACGYFEAVGDRRADSLHNLATCYFTGRGRSLDYARARILYRTAADAGYVQSHCALGNMLVHGQGGEPDPSAGIALCRHAADLGDKHAQTDFGGYLLMGRGVERDPISARRYLTSAAEHGQQNASFLLGQIYEKGDGVETSPELARKWFERSYTGGRTDAAFALMRSYLRSSAIERDGKRGFDRAYLFDIRKWAAIAAEQDPDPKNRSDAAEILTSLKD